MSFKTLKRAYSVLWKGLKLDWKISKIWFLFKNDWSQHNKTFPKILEIKGTTEIGRKWFKSDVSKEGFLSRRVTVATFRHVGTKPVSRHLFKRDTRPGPTESTTSLKNRGCFISCGQEEVLKVAIISVRWRGEIGSKTSHEANGWLDTQELT